MARKKKLIDERVDIQALKKYLLSHLDETNQVEMDKLSRYIELSQLVRLLLDDVKKDGATIRVINGAQKYIKPHPAISEINKINTTLLSIERSFNFENLNDEFKESDFT